jgi:anti-anti-sigma regulatory factor
VAELDNDPPATIAIETQLDGSGSPIVILSGELDASNVASLQTAMASVTTSAPERDTAAKVSEVHLRQPSPIIRRVLESTGLASLLTVEP